MFPTMRLLESTLPVTATGSLQVGFRACEVEQDTGLLGPSYSSFVTQTLNRVWVSGLTAAVAPKSLQTLR